MNDENETTPPRTGYWHLWTDAGGVSHQSRCELTQFEQRAVAARVVVNHFHQHGQVAGTCEEESFLHAACDTGMLGGVRCRVVRGPVCATNITSAAVDDTTPFPNAIQERRSSAGSWR